MKQGEKTKARSASLTRMSYFFMSAERVTVTNGGGVTSYQKTTINASDDSNDDGDNTALIGGLVASCLIILALVAVLGFVLYS